MVISSDRRALIIKIQKNKFQNDSSSADAQFALQVNQWLLKPLGIWPLTKHSSFIEKIVTAILVIVCSILLAFVSVPGLFLLINVKSFTARLNLLTGPFSFYVMLLMKYHSLVSGQQDLSNCIEQIIADWRELSSVNDRNIMMDYAKYDGRFGAVICAVFMYGGGIFYTGILPRISGNIVNINNETIRPLAYPGYYRFFNPQLSPAYEIVYGIHCCCAFVMHSITSATCSLLVVFVMHACGQLKIIIVWLKNLVNDTENNEDSNERFSKIIQQHVRTLRFINNIEKVLCEICLVEVVGCTLNICVLGYNLLLQWGKSDAIGIMTFATLQISFIFNIFLLCYIGELLTEEVMRTSVTYLNLLRTFME
ncbi:hypothetical protein PV326_003281 [Microctonus aethiopoides]|nr:hypothetical protein PV326_003281 [Microctonus aethiopoides]